MFTPNVFLFDRKARRGAKYSLVPPAFMVERLPLSLPPMIDLKNFDAVIFDMDGVLTDSEPLWKIAMEEVFRSVGCSLTRKDFQKTVGLRIDEVCDYWYNEGAWEGATPKEVEDKIMERMVELIHDCLLYTSDAADD